ncbi:MAG TPA: ATP-binding protein [Bryobacteraceae bacterium]|nr:ATP-binding protein [Bryobacteraceae bacterium]
MSSAIQPPDATPRLIILVGLPGSGKSSWARQQGFTALSSDTMRFWLADNEDDQTIHREVFATLRYLIRRRLELRRPVTLVDATNLTRGERRTYIKLAQVHGCRAEAVFFDVPVELCKQRNRARTRVVPDEVIEAMSSRLTAPEVTEGFASVTVYSSRAAAPQPMPPPGLAASPQ